MAYGDAETAQRLWTEADTTQAELDGLDAKQDRLEAERQPAREAMREARAAGDEQALAAADHALTSIADELGAVRSRRRELGDPDAMRAEALTVKERWFRESGGPEAAALEGIATRLDELAATSRRITHARAELVGSREQLEVVDEQLVAAGRAPGSTLGRVVRLDATRYQTMEDVTRALRRAEQQAQALREDLDGLASADLHLDTASLHAGPGGWAVGVVSGRGHRRRVDRALVSVRVALAEVGRLDADLAARHAALAAEAASLGSQRREWLGFT